MFCDNPIFYSIAGQSGNNGGKKIKSVNFA